MQQDTYPGTPHHQRVLRAVVAHYADDARLLAVVVFGSLGRANWDRFSDLDLDLVLADGVAVDAVEELRRLCASFAAVGERAAVIVPKRADEGDVLLASLLQLSVRYHPLATTSPNIADSMRLLWGRIDAEAIRAAALANAPAAPEPLDVLCARCVRSLLEADVALQRRRLWFALDALEWARGALIEIFARARGAVRPLHAFQDQADAALQARLGATLPGPTLAAAQRALLCCLDLLESDLPALAAGQATLTEPQREVLRRVRERQAALRLD
jgi:hypothetical protein